MKLSAPTRVMFIASVVVFIIGILLALLASLGLESYGIWIVALAYLLLAIGCLLKGK